MPVISPGGRFSSAFPLWDGTGRILVTWSECRLQDTTGTILPCTAANLAAARRPTPRSPRRRCSTVPGCSIRSPTRSSRSSRRPKACSSPTSSRCSRGRPRLPYIADSYTGRPPSPVGILDIRSVYDWDGAAWSGTGCGRHCRDGADRGRSAPGALPATGKSGLDSRQADARISIATPRSASPATTCARSSATCRSSRTARCASRCRPTSPFRSRWSTPTRARDLSAAPRLAAAAAGRGAQLQRLPPAAGAADARWPAAASIRTAAPGTFASAWTGSTGDRPVPGHRRARTPPVHGRNHGRGAGRLRTAATRPTRRPRRRHRASMWSSTTRGSAAAPATSRCCCRMTIRPSPRRCRPRRPARCLAAGPPIAASSSTTRRIIQPLWDKDRGANTCVNCHTAIYRGHRLSGSGRWRLGDQCQSGQRLSAAAAALQCHHHQPDHRSDHATTTVRAAEFISGDALDSHFFQVFATDATHIGLLSPAELRLLSEWVDIGAQYYNNPFARSDELSSRIAARALRAVAGSDAGARRARAAAAVRHAAVPGAAYRTRARLSGRRRWWRAANRSMCCSAAPTGSRCAPSAASRAGPRRAI